MTFYNSIIPEREKLAESGEKYIFRIWFFPFLFSFIYFF